MDKKFKIAVAQLNPLVGDVIGNVDKLIKIRSKLENDIANSRVLDKVTDTSSVHLLTEVVIKNLQNGVEMKYAIVSESEADFKNKKISVESPIGKGLMGKSIGEIARIKVPNGTIEFEVMQINSL